MSKSKKSDNIKFQPTKRRRQTPYEKQQEDLNQLLEKMSQEISSLYVSLENLLIYTTVVANVNAALASILIKKKITTEKGIQKEYDKILVEMKKKQEEIKKDLEKIDKSDISKFAADLDFSDMDISNMKVS